jgi:hypothetical protein
MEEETKEKSTQVTGCRQCKQELSKTQKVMVGGGVFVLGTSVYGTIQLIKLLISLF